MIRIFLVDDHPMVIEGLHNMLLQIDDVQVVGHAANAASCLGFFVSNDADVVLLDINLPDESGIDLCRKILKKKDGVKIIALTNNEQLSYLHGMKDAGAKGYLLKNASLQMIESALRSVLSGNECWLGKDNIRDSLSNDSQLLLTRREVEVLKLIAEGLTNPEIADKLYVSASTIDSHRKNMISKLQVKNTAALIRKAFEKKII